MHQKIRLCTLVLNVDSIRKEVLFVPDRSNMDSKCYRGIVQLHQMNYTLEDDWMIGCKVVSVERTEPAVYYISAGFESFDPFICKEPHNEKNMVGGIGCRINVSKKISMTVRR